MILLDTTFVIDLVDGDPGAARLARDLDKTGVTPSISVISAHEYMVGVHLKYHGKRTLNEEVLAAKNELSRFRILPFTRGLVMTSSRINAEAIKKGKIIDTNDIYIAATALYYSMALVSRNTRHFNGIPGLGLKGY